GAPPARRSAPRPGAPAADRRSLRRRRAWCLDEGTAAVGVEGAVSELPLVSADSHVVEPGDVWTTRMDRRWGDRTPRVVVGHAGTPGAVSVGEAVPPFGIAAFSGADVAPEELPAHFTKGYERVRPGGWDPAARLRDQARDGVVAEVVYPSLALQL